MTNMKTVGEFIEKLRGQTSDLDTEMGGISCNLEVLSDVQSALYNLKEDMNDKLRQENGYLYINEFHAEIRILAELMLYSMKDLNKNYENANKIHQAMFKTAVDLEESEHKKSQSLAGTSNRHLSNTNY